MKRKKLIEKLQQLNAVLRVNLVADRKSINYCAVRCDTMEIALENSEFLIAFLETSLISNENE